MAIIPKTLFGWEEEFNNLGDLVRLQILLDTLPDETLMKKLRDDRGKGRNDFSVEAMWNLVIAGIVFGHNTIASLLRELNRNKQLCYVCGFRFQKLPKAYNMSRFVTILLKHLSEIDEMFIRLSDELYLSLEGYGEELAIDSKWINSAANTVSKRKSPDGRSETDARKGKKSYSGVRDDGSLWAKTVSCFGFKIHLLVDAVYELPIAYSITDAAASDVVHAKKIVTDLNTNRPEVLNICQYLMADRGYDDTNLIELLKNEGVKAVIDKRTMWKTETEKEVPGYIDAYYDEHGNVYCYSKNKGDRRQMALNGYENDRDSLRFKCPAKAYGFKCTEIDECHCKNIRITLSTDRRIFTQVQRQSYKWKSLYRKRTAVERVNSRLDIGYGFEERRTRGLPRAKLQVGISLLVMLAVAVWCVRNNQKGKIRSLMKIA